MRIAFLDVDTQFDFMDPAGALHVRGAEALGPNLKKLTDFALARQIPVVASADAHPLLDPEFQQFPPHCLKGTPGARRIPETRIEGAFVVGAGDPVAPAALRAMPRIVVEKRAFDLFSNPAAERVVRTVGARDWVVYGVATDYCVRAAALGLRKRGYDVTVVTDAVKGVTRDGEAKAIEAMRKAGVRFIETDVLLAAIDRAAAGLPEPPPAKARRPRARAKPAPKTASRRAPRGAKRPKGVRKPARRRHA